MWRVIKIHAVDLAVMDGAMIVLLCVFENLLEPYTAAVATHWSGRMEIAQWLTKNYQNCTRQAKCSQSDPSVGSLASSS